MHPPPDYTIHYVWKGRCTHCQLLKEQHLEGKCLFDSTEFHQDTTVEHIDNCICDEVVEINAEATEIKHVSP